MSTKELSTVKEKIFAEMGRFVVFNVNHVSHLFAKRTNRSLAKAGISIQLEQLPVLIVVNASTDGTLSQQDIANLLQKDKSGIQRSIRTLERDGYIRITSDHLDRRKNLVQMTPVGRMVVNQIMGTAKQLDEEITNQLEPEEVITLIKLLRKVSALVEN